LWAEECAVLALPTSTRLPELVEIVTSDQSGKRAVFRIVMLETGPHYGGSRQWYACPRCGRRAAKLYAPAVNLLACRKCLRLVYRCQYRKQSLWEQLLRVAWGF